MKTKFLLRLIVFLTFCILIISCTPEMIILHSDLSGLVTDSETNNPLSAAKVILYPLNDSTTTDSTGIYKFLNIESKEYEIKVSRDDYISTSVNTKMKPGETNEINVLLDKLPVPVVSESFLDFGFESTSMSFTISCAYKQKVNFFFTPSQDWIEVSPPTVQIGDDPVTISVNINKSG